MSSSKINKHDECGLTALYRAVRQGDVAEVERLLAAGADPNVAMKNFAQQTALHVAQKFEVVRLLINHGAEIDAVDRDGATPLHHLSGAVDASSAEFLCFKGANVNHRDNDSVTPIFDAIESGEVAAFETVIAFDADIDVSTSNSTPLTSAVECGSLDCFRLLLLLNAADMAKVHADGWTVAKTDKEMQQLLAEHSKKSEKERQELRLETLNRIRSQLSIRLMRYAQPEIIGICIAMSSLELPPYVLLWIIDWLPNYDRLSPRHKIHLIESVRNSIWKIKERKEVRQRFGLRQRKKYTCIAGTGQNK